jgi:hypothetical protein
MPLGLQVSALAVSAIYYLWRDGYVAALCQERKRRDRLLRERMTYMLWVAVQSCP